MRRTAPRTRNRTRKRPPVEATDGLFLIGGRRSAFGPLGFALGGRSFLGGLRGNFSRLFHVADRRRLLAGRRLLGGRSELFGRKRRRLLLEHLLQHIDALGLEVGLL